WFRQRNVEQNIAFGLQMRKVSRADMKRRVADAIELVKLQEHSKKLPGQLSGGQQQRVAIARAIVLEPSLVLMDEPLSNLDAKLRLDMRTEIRRLHQSLGLTTIYVTHDQEEALSMADRLVVLREGRVQQVGTPEELHTAPVNWHVADFMRYRNLLDVTVTESGADGVLVTNEDLHIRGTAVGGVAKDRPARLAIRPEDLRIATGQDSGEGLIDAEVAWWSTTVGSSPWARRRRPVPPCTCGARSRRSRGTRSGSGWTPPGRWCSPPTWMQPERR